MKCYASKLFCFFEEKCYSVLVNHISEYWSCFYRKLLSLYLVKSSNPVHKSVSWLWFAGKKLRHYKSIHLSGCPKLFFCVTYQLCKSESNHHMQSDAGTYRKKWKKIRIWGGKSLPPESGLYREGSHFFPPHKDFFSILQWVQALKCLPLSLQSGI